MTRDATAMHVPLPGDSEAVRRKLIALIEANKSYNCTLRLVVVRNGGGMWAGPSNGRAGDLIALTAESKDWGEGVKLAYQENGRHAACPFAGTKILSWAMNLTWLESAQWRGFDEVILLNERGEVAECTSANIFIANGNEVWTPPLTSGCLPGITRELLLSDVRRRESKSARSPSPRKRWKRRTKYLSPRPRAICCPCFKWKRKKVGRSGATRLALAAVFGEYVRNYIAERR